MICIFHKSYISKKKIEDRHIKRYFGGIFIKLGIDLQPIFSCHLNFLELITHRIQITFVSK